MRPTPAETIAGVRTILRDVVEPAVDSEYARARLREIRAVLAQTDWDNAALRLRREVEGLRALLAEIRDWAEDDPERSSAFADLAGEVTGPAGPDQETFSALNDLRAAHAAALVEAADRLAGWTRSRPRDESARELRLRLIGHLAAGPPAR
ncbi:hypothetical protein F8568_023270 [Actinomadura sp. LD22]|uniref:Uncharacterized protein n=1 Tax=Actinomadura physcomitrii TaxID=2650748 RepID=A0A6I4MGF2_9ACTN|nr:hypothetical protein [Actinomadura physcomitrii]MWA03244.1 hypothetical protein [Actinomadura physcomitrii]